MRIFLIAVLLINFTATLNAFVPGDFEDDFDFSVFPGVQGAAAVGLNQGVQVHTCFGNALMRGNDSASNRLMCSPASSVGTPVVDIGPPVGTQGTFFYRGGSHRVHVCPAGSAMVGLHLGNNWLICAPATGLTNIHVDLDTQELEPNQNKGQKMHVCDGNAVMVGISDADNALICASHP